MPNISDFLFGGAVVVAEAVQDAVGGEQAQLIESAVTRICALDVRRQAGRG